jgi:hypothetical protein
VDAWLVDAWGQAHPVAATGTVIGRRTDLDLAVLHDSVSRVHARMSRSSSGWGLRDLGSRNGCTIAGRPIQGRAIIDDGELVGFGKVRFFFHAEGSSLTLRPPHSLSTQADASHGLFRCALQCESTGRQLQLVGPGHASDAIAGVLLTRPAGVTDWSEMNLSPLEFQLLRVLCERAREAARSESEFTESHVPTAELARVLPFRSDAADDENVRQAVRRTRQALQQLGINDLIVAVPRRGYRVTWPIT